jgi:3-oxoacyl-[acyl-carrier protein] reductase
MRSLESKVAIITGGASGIGETITRTLAQAGARVVINYNSSKDKAEALENEIKEAGGEASLFQGDISSFDTAKALIDHTLSTYGSVNILVLNAGITRDGLLMRMDESQFDSVIATNLKGVWNVARHAMKPLLKSGYGRIIAISSVAGLSGNAGQSNYAAAKAGVIGLIKSIARESASRGVTANAVAPGLIASPMTDALSEDLKSAITENIPLRRLGEAREVAAAVLYLASPEAAYVTGSTLEVDGGLTMR